MSSYWTVKASSNLPSTWMRPACKSATTLRETNQTLINWNSAEFQTMRPKATGSSHHTTKTSTWKCRLESNRTITLARIRPSPISASTWRTSPSKELLSPATSLRLRSTLPFSQPSRTPKASLYTAQPLKAKLRSTNGWSRWTATPSSPITSFAAQVSTPTFSHLAPTRPARMTSATSALRAGNRPPNEQSD